MRKRPIILGKGETHPPRAWVVGPAGAHTTRIQWRLPPPPKEYARNPGERAAFEADLRRVIDFLKHRKEKEPFEVLELGCGKYPFGLLKKALRSQKKGQKRIYNGVDLQEVDLDRMLRMMGVSARPKNLNFAARCVINALENLPTSSKRLVFASYLVNNFSGMHVRESGTINKHAAFFLEAERVLAPGGRLIIVGDYGNRLEYEQFAKIMGLRFHSIKIPDPVARESPSDAITMRGFFMVRNGIYEEGKREKDPVSDTADEYTQKGILKHPSDYYIPTVYFFRKPGIPRSKGK